MNEGIHLDLDTWIVPGQISKANLCRGLGNRYTPAGTEVLEGQYVIPHLSFTTASLNATQHQQNPTHPQPQPTTPTHKSASARHLHDCNLQSAKYPTHALLDTVISHLVI